MTRITPKLFDEHREEAHGRVHHPYFYVEGQVRKTKSKRDRALAATHLPEEFDALFNEFRAICPEVLLASLNTGNPPIVGAQLLMSPVCVPYWHFRVGSWEELLNPAVRGEVLRIQKKHKHRYCVAELEAIERENPPPSSPPPPTKGCQRIKM